MRLKVSGGNSGAGGRPRQHGDGTGCSASRAGWDTRRTAHAGANFPGVGGQITAIEGSTLTLQTFRGETAKVNITSSTRLTKDRNEAKLSDFKVGDRVFAAGEQGKDGVWTARMLAQRSGGGLRGGMAQQKPEDNGKTYILGEVAKIDGTKLTIKKPDNSEQVIEVDDDTSFRNERRESVTLAEMKVGDFVRGQGSTEERGICAERVECR